MKSRLSSVKIRKTDVEIIDGDRGANYPKKNDFSSCGYCLFLDASNVTKNGFVFDNPQFITQAKDDQLGNGKLKRHDIVLTTRGTIGNFAYYGVDIPYDNIRINSGMLILRNKSDFDTKYLYQLLKSPYIKQQIINMTTGSSQPQITRAIIKELILLKPELSAQIKISNILYSLDKKIELNNRINTKLEELAKLIYDYWFVQFDFPDENGKPYKFSGGKMVENEELKKKIPERWSVKHISDCLTTSLGGTPSTKMKEYWENGDIPWLSSEEVSDFPILSSNKKISNAGLKNSAASLLPEGSVVISIVRYIRTSILGMQATTNQSVVAILESDLLKKSYIYPFLISKTRKLMSLRTGAQQPHINKNVIDTTQILIPDEKVLRDYYELVNPMYEYIIAIATETKKLTELRDWLLPMLMNGQVRVQ